MADIRVSNFIKLNVRVLIKKKINFCKIMDNPNILHFIIHLPRNKERKLHLEKNVLPRIQNKKVINGIDWKINNLSKLLIENNISIHNPNDFLKGQVGCFLSHFLIWKYIISNNIEEIIILEDDVTIPKNYYHLLKDINEIKIDNPEFIYLYNHPAKYKNDYSEELRMFYALENFGTVGYYLTKSGAKKLIENFKTLVGPVDRQINFLILKKVLNGYMLNISVLNTCGKIVKKMEDKKYFDSNVWESDKFSLINEKIP